MKLPVAIAILFTLDCTFCSVNRLNRQGQRKGKWITYTDSTRSRKMFEGRFRNGKSVGKASYYTLDGVLERTEVSRFKTLRTTLYHPNGRVALRGQAKIEETPEKIHYYFYGKWSYYDQSGKLYKYGYFEKGKLIHDEYMVKQHSDTLMRYLKNIDQAFVSRHSALINSINRADPLYSEPYRRQLYDRDSLVFDRIGHFLMDYGYPDSSFAEAANVPFFVLSYGTIAVRAKYLDLLKQAASEKRLDWPSLCFYIDKLQLAKGEKQIYGTQYYLKNAGLVYFPIADSVNLQKRRAEVGLKD